MSAPLDRDHFDHMTGADRALQLEVVALFRVQAEQARAALNAAASWRPIVHTLKGAARGIGLEPLAGACEAAEDAEEAGLAAALAAIGAALDEALAALDQFAAEAA